MDSKEEYRKLIKSVKSYALASGEKITDKNIAEKLGYDKSYFSALISKAGKITESHLAVFREKFKDELQGVKSPSIKSEEQVTQTAIIKMLFNEVAKIEAYIYDRSIEDCLKGMEQNTTLILKDMLKDKS